MNNFLSEKAWHVPEDIIIPAREKQLFSYDDLPLSDNTQKYMQTCLPDGIYLHQKESIKASMNGRNVCIATGTASGKSMVFYSMGIETLAHDFTSSPCDYCT